MSNALVLFMKAPRPGTVKTRLTPHVTMDEAAELYRAFILDTLHLAQRTAAATLFVAWTPDDGRTELGSALGCLGDPDVNWLRQRGSHLGERLSNAFADSGRTDGKRPSYWAVTAPSSPWLSSKRLSRHWTGTTSCSVPPMMAATT